jgi:hypothetical protein
MEHKLFFLESAFREEFILEFLNHSMDEWAGGFEPPQSGDIIRDSLFSKFLI